MTAFFLFLAFAAAAQEPESAAIVVSSGTPRALLWVPREENIDWDALVTLSSEVPGFGLTVAVSPAAYAEIPEETLAALPPAIEFAMRPAGDPVLPLIKDLQASGLGFTAPDLPAFSRPQDVIARLGLKSEYAGIRAPGPGLVPAAGALSHELLTVFAPSGFAWVAAGQPKGLASTGPWRDARGTAFVSFEPLAHDLSNWKPASAGPASYVFDPTLDLAQAPGTLLSLRELASSATASGVRLMNVSDYLKEPEVAARLEASSATLESPAASFRPWNGDYSAWTGQPLQRAAWRLLASVARQVDAQQNAAVAPPRALEAAGRELLNAEGGRFFLNLDTRQPAAVREAADREFRVTLVNVFRILKQAPPEELQKPLVEEAAPESGIAGAAVESEEDWLAFRDPSGDNGTPTSAPAGKEVWDLERFAVAWDTATVTFTVTLSTVVNPLGTPRGFSYVLLDLYIDLNHRVGAGQTTLLPGRESMAEARDAWEFAVALTGWGGKLYRIGPEGQIAELQPVTPRLDEAAGTVSVDVPAAVLRGNPRKWGYLAVVMALDPNSASSELWLPLKDARSSPLLDVLAPWQTEPLTASQRRRLEFVRIK